MTQQEIIDRVRALMNEIGADEEPSSLSEDSVRLGDYIAEAIPDAVSLVQKNVPAGSVNPKAANVETLSLQSNGDGTGRLLLPDDYVRLRSLKLTGWRRVCTQASTTDSPLYLAQQNENTRAGKDKPVCIEQMDANGNRVLEYYSQNLTGVPVLEHFVYEARYNPNDGVRGKNPLFLSAICYICASLVYMMFENKASAEAMMSLAAESMKG